MICMKNKKVAILGAGNIGIYLCALYKSKGYSVTLLTDKTMIQKTIRVFTDDGLLYDENIEIPDSKTVDDFDMCIVTYPSHVLRRRLSEYSINKNATLYYIIGEGNIKSLFEGYSNKIAVFTRVPVISRLIDKNSVNVSVKDQSLIYTTLNCKNDIEIQQHLNEIYHNKMIYCEDSHVVTLTPTNQVIHTTRIYNLFRDSLLIDSDKYFYADWTDDDSKLLIEMSDEIHECAKLLKIENYVPEVLPHYDCNNYKDLTKKIRSIKSLSEIRLPIIKTKNDRYYLDVESRYVESDFDFGLRAIKALLDKYNLKSDTVSAVLKWFDEVVKNNENDL